MKKTLTLIFPIFLIAAFLLGRPATAAADDDPPSRVARLNYMQGSVSYQPSGEQDWIDANPNRPLTTGDDLWADRNSRGELHIGSTAIRLSNETGISFLNLDDRTVQLQLAQGVIEIHVRHLESDEAFEIDTPNLAFTITRAGVYRIRTDPDGRATVIIVREGAGEVSGGGASWELDAGQRYEFRGTDELGYDVREAPGLDDFERWCQERDLRENRSRSSRYVSRDLEGAYDLDDHGDWRDDSDYGAVWYPRGVAYGWAPYHYGHWVWISPWGWTWVGDEPWGFAPYHYGRWVFVRERWGWVPGPIVARPVYAPHLVAFVGGGGLSVAVGIGGGVAGVAWFPLGPRDVWVPGYRASPRYVQNVNVTNTRVVNVTQVTNVYNTTVVNNNVNVSQTNYMYARQAGAVTAVRREDFVGARSVSQTAVKITPEQIQNARPVKGEKQEQLAPTRASYVAATAKPAPPSSRPAVPFTDRKVVAKINPPPPPSGARVPTIVNAQKPPAGGTPPAGANKNAEGPPRGNAVDQPPSKGNRNAEPPARGNAVQQPPPAQTIPATPPAGANKNAEGPPRGNAADQPPSRGNRNAEPPARGNTVQQPPPAQTTPATPTAGANKNAEAPPRGNAADQPPSRGNRNAEPPARGNTVDQPPSRGNRNAEPPARGNNAEQPPPAQTKPFTPPAGGNKNVEAPPRGNAADQPPSRGNRNAEPPARGNAVQQPPPAQTNDSRTPRDTRPTPPPRQEERRVEPPPRQEAHPQPPPKQEARPAPPAKEKEKDKGKDKEKDKEAQPPRGWR